VARPTRRRQAEAGARRTLAAPALDRMLQGRWSADIQRIARPLEPPVAPPSVAGQSASPLARRAAAAAKALMLPILAGGEPAVGGAAGEGVGRAGPGHAVSRLCKFHPPPTPPLAHWTRSKHEGRA
jgi:hypothetical protein